VNSNVRAGSSPALSTKPLQLKGLFLLYIFMGAFVISKRFNGEYKFVFTSRKGKTIFTSAGYLTIEDCEKSIQMVKDSISNFTYAKLKASGGKFYFKIVLDDQLVATSRKYTTELRVQKGIDEVIAYAAKAEVLDFSTSDLVFED
jgi:uncharacterized protein YegP (UPF0339 family)